MEKEPQPESIVGVKTEYAPSEYSSEPPPAYVRPKSAAVQVARIVAYTVVATAFVLGAFVLASAYVSANAACGQFERELELLGDAAAAADRLQPQQEERLRPEALVQDQQSAHSKRSSNSIDSDDSENDSSDSDSSSDSEPSSESSEDRSHFDLEQLASHLLDKNRKTKMNCVVEKRRAEEVVDHKPKTIRLPFGVNLTTDPRLEVRSGERMVIVCESGSVGSAQPQPTQEAQKPSSSDSEDSEEDSSASEAEPDDEENTIMIQPVMIPIPQARFETHMPQRMMPQQHHVQFMPQQPPPPPFMAQQRQEPQQMMQRMPQFVQIQIEPQQQMPQQAQQQQQQQAEPDFPPNPILRHIVQQIIAQKIMEARRVQMAQQQQQQQQMDIERQQQHRFQMPQQQQMTQQQAPQQQQQQQQPQYAPRFPIPEEVLTQLNRLPNRDMIVAVSSESDSSEEGQDAQQPPRSSEEAQKPQEIRLVPQNQEIRPEIVAQEIRFMQQPRRSAADMNGRQSFAQIVPQIVRAEQPQQAQQVAQQVEVQDHEEGTTRQMVEESRPHFVQPRSITLESQV